LLIPALVILTLLVAARLVYPRPEDMETDTPNLDTGNLPQSSGFIWPGRRWSRRASPISR
jgi:hypothetical protein